MKPLDKLKIEKALESFDPYDESIPPDQWAQLRNAQLASQPESTPSVTAFHWLEADLDFEIELRKVWKDKMEGPAMDTLLALVNMGDSPQEIQAVRLLIKPQYDISRDRDEELIVLRDQLRAFWNEALRENRASSRRFGDNESIALALHAWWSKYLVPSEGWKVFWEVGRLYPTQKNFRGQIAKILFEKRRRLSQCPRCTEYFIKSRADQKNCLSSSCQAQANNDRQRKFQQAKQRQLKKTGRKA